MGLEAATYVADLVSTNPVVGDNVAEGDDHLRLIKATLQTTFPAASRAIYPWRASAVSADQTLAATDDGKIYSVDATAANRSITLPSSPAAGFRIAVVKSDAGANTISVVRAGSDTINGATSHTISYQYQAAMYVYIGSNIWLIIAISHPRYMIGPASGTDERIMRYDGTGFVLQSSPVGISDAGAVTGTTSITPASSGGGSLGSAALPYLNLFLAGTGKVDFGNGDVTVTAGVNSLAFAGASAGYSFDNNVSVVDGNNYFRISGTSPGWVVDNQDEMVYDRTNNLWKPTIAAALVGQWGATALSPGASDAQALGTTALMWADLFLASGAVLNWNNGNVTLTHSAATLTLAGATSLAMGTSIAVGLGTIELGHASDTTLARASAGDANIEGNIIYRAGGTDVPLTDGGTGSSTAAGARTNLGLDGVLAFNHLYCA